MKTSTTTTKAAENREAILHLYQVILNEREFDRLGELVSEQYSNSQGGTGIAGFKKGVADVVAAFQDAHWSIEELVADDDKVMVRQNFTGTQTGVFQGIQPTGRKISNDGFGVYQFRNGKIVSHRIQADRLSFLQQLGELPTDLSSPAKSSDSSVYFVDKFVIPAQAEEEFVRQMEYNRKFIKTLPGFIGDKVISRRDENGNLNLVTIAEWRSEEHLEKAKAMVKDEYNRIQFNPAGFLQKLNITMDRQEYRIHK